MHRDRSRRRGWFCHGQPRAFGLKSPQTRLHRCVEHALLDGADERGDLAVDAGELFFALGAFAAGMGGDPVHFVPPDARELGDEIRQQHLVANGAEYTAFHSLPGTRVPPTGDES